MQSVDYHCAFERGRPSIQVNSDRYLHSSYRTLTLVPQEFTWIQYLLISVNINILSALRGISPAFAVLSHTAVPSIIKVYGCSTMTVFMIGDVLS